jgi:hypothetical protein
MPRYHCRVFSNESIQSNQSSLFSGDSPAVVSCAVQNGNGSTTGSRRIGMSYFIAPKPDSAPGRGESLFCTARIILNTPIS